VHRDLKLANIMLDDARNVRLIDFGLAKMLGDDLDSEENEQGREPGASRLSVSEEQEHAFGDPSPLRLVVHTPDSPDSPTSPDIFDSACSRGSPDSSCSPNSVLPHLPPCSSPGLCRSLSSVLYDMTGGTGSYKYMAPEVFLGRGVATRPFVGSRLYTFLVWYAGCGRRRAVGDKHGSA
jgi:serine/threonine protein kinase